MSSSDPQPTPSTHLPEEQKEETDSSPPRRDEPPSPPQTHVLHRSTHHTFPLITSATGQHLTLSSGLRILDASCGAAVTCLGHAHPTITSRLANHLTSSSSSPPPIYAHSLAFRVAPAEALATALVASTGGRMARALFLSSGSEAVDAALKLARQFHVEREGAGSRRTKFVARRGSYHGATVGGLSVGGHLARRRVFEGMLGFGEVGRVSACNEYRGRGEGEGARAFVERLAREVEGEFERAGEGEVCAFVAETVVGAALGCVPPVAGYFRAIASICERHGALLILDEIMCGMGRCGTMHAWEAEGIVPDIQVIGKGLGGGYVPISGILVGHRVFDTLHGGSGSFAHGQTYQGHALACVAALEVQRVIREGGLVENVRRMGEVLGRLLGEALRGCRFVGDIRGRGLFWGIEFVQDKTTKEPFDPKEGISMAIHTKGFEEKHAIFVYPGSGTADGWAGDHILLAPVYTVTRKEIEDIVERTAKLINDFFEERSQRMQEQKISLVAF